MGQVNKKSAEKNTQPNEDVINPDSYTVIMPNDDMRKPCLVCGERFIDFWNDDEEEWMYKNAIMVEDKVILLLLICDFFFLLNELYTRFITLHVMRMLLKVEIWQMSTQKCWMRATIQI